MNLGDKQIKLLEKLIDVSAVRHRVIANNMANVNTPGYKRLEVSFENELKAALNGNSTKDISLVQPKVVVSKDPGTMRNDGNNVTMEGEVSSLVKNALTYNIYVQLLSKKFAALKTAIGGGRSI